MFLWRGSIIPEDGGAIENCRPAGEMLQHI